MNTELLDDKQFVETTPPLNFAPCETDPSSEEVASEDSTTRLANIVLDHRSESTLEEIQGAVAFSSALTRLKGNPDATKLFFEKLRLGNYLTKAEAEVGISEQSDSTVSKIRKIEKFSDILFKREVYRFLRPGIELLYEAAQLVEVTGLTGTDAVAKVSAILASSDGPIKRPWLKKERNKLTPKPPREKRETEETGSSVSCLPSQPGDADGSPTPVSSVVEPAAGTPHTPQSSLGDANLLAVKPTGVADKHVLDSNHVSSAQVEVTERDESHYVVAAGIADVTGANHGTRHRAVMLTINEADAERLSLRATEDLACFSAASSMASDSALFAFTTAKALLDLAPIVRRFQFKRCAAVILLKNGEAGEISDHPVLAVFERGASLIKPPLGADFSQCPTAIVELMLKDGLDGPRLHLFADVATDGWETVLTKDAWSIA